MKDRPTTDTLFALLNSWAEAEEGIEAVALVGSHARGKARNDSDIDVVILATSPATYLANTLWVETFGTVTHFRREDYGAVQSLRVFYADGLEVEFALTSVEWASIERVDDGTH